LQIQDPETNAVHHGCF